MGHDVQAFIGHRETLESLRACYHASRVVVLAGDWTLLPLTAMLFEAIAPASDRAERSEKGFEFLTGAIRRVLLHHSASRDLAYIETSYFGGSGDQGAIVARHGRVIFGPQLGAGSINAALLLLGVEKGTAHDEYDALGLGRHRSNEAWVERGADGESA